MHKELEKTYNPQDIENRLYEKWMKNRYFHAEVDRSKKPFTIVMPPPNVTGQLHMGHALDNTMQDILIRFKRMQGYNALWQPGTDHAAIATEVKVIEKLKAQGIEKEDLGREGFLKEAYAWKDEYGARIVSQLKRLGTSADWERERFTMDEGCSDAVLEVFVNLYKKGYIYKGSRIINWCPVCQTSISDAEVIHEEQDGFFYHIKYPIIGTEDFLEIATTRPETMLGDVAVAVNPEDDRYADLVGKMLLLPLVNKEIPVIADEYVDKAFGTGCVKITPAHDPTDFEVGKRHHLPEINILNDDATINEKGGGYAGMDRYTARKKIIEDLDALGLFVKKVPHSHNVGIHDRCKTTIEPMIKPQWFVKMDEMKKPALEAVKNGQLQFVPEHFEKTYTNWLENLHDWCISRQLWWGHRIPAYYCQSCGGVVVQKTAPDTCPHCGGHDFHQDEDTLDTWFSSALWPFSTLGWPEKTPEMEYFYPTDVLVTGYDIILFWVIRMVFSGYEQTGKSPFHTVLIHGLVRDAQGRKMSKSLGNGIDPLEVIDQYGADALRMTLITGNAPGNDMRFYFERVEASRNFANKIWNASRFILMNMGEEKPPVPEMEALTMADRWILAKANDLARDVTDNLDKYELGIALSKVYDFIWEEFCDWYIEMVKPRLWAEKDPTRNSALWTLQQVLIQSLKLLHPFMPFITEEIFCNLQEDEPSIMISSWPVFREDWAFREEEESVEMLKEGVREIRKVRTNMQVPPSRKAQVFVVSPSEEIRHIFKKNADFFGMLGYASQVHIQETNQGIEADAVTAILPEAVIYMPFADLVDLEKERARLDKEIARLEDEIERTTRMLSNVRFVEKAPAEKIQEERDKQEKYEALLAQARKQREAIS